jgi:hypothetical protein
MRTPETGRDHSSVRRWSTTAAGLAAVALAVGPVPAAAATGWDALDLTETTSAVNPCTGLVTELVLHADRLHVAGGGASSSEGIHFTGTYTAADGSAGRFRDTDQGVDLSTDGDFVFSQRVVFVGTYEGRRQVSHLVAHVTVTGDTERVFLFRVDAHCTPA